MMTQNEVVTKGYQALVETLGGVDAIRFLQHFSQGSDDYTHDRAQWLEQLTVEAVLANMEAIQRKNETSTERS